MTPHVSTAHEIETASGRYFDLSAPRAEDVELEDIAHALSHLCRFNGHCRTFYADEETTARAWRITFEDTLDASASDETHSPTEEDRR